MKQVKGWFFPDADEFMAAEMDENGNYQAKNLQTALKYVRRFGVAVDGGAHVGTWTRKLAQRFEHVIAFEPAADTFAALSENMRQYDCELYNQALSDRFERVRMTLEGSRLDIRRRNTGARYMRPGDEVEAITLDSFNMPQLDFLKLDVEGAELKALTGARYTLTRCKPVVLFEDKARCQQRFGYRREMIYALLGSLGYRRLARAKNDEIWGPQ